MDKDMFRESCGNCMYGKVIYVPDKMISVCRKHSPELVGRCESPFPPFPPDEWCGEWFPENEHGHMLAGNKEQKEEYKK